MSSRRTGASPLPDSRGRNPGRAAPDGRRCVASTLPPTKKRGRRQPEAGDFQVSCELPHLPPISDKELRAVEILLGSELRDLLADSMNSED